MGSHWISMRVPWWCGALYMFVCVVVPLLAVSHAHQLSEEEANRFERKGIPSRFMTPWQTVQPLKLPTLKQSHYRVLYSPLRLLGSEGMGHGFATKNMEVSAAIRLGLAYTHRRPKFGTLSLKNPMIMEDFFGWGDNELNGKAFQKYNCKPSPPPKRPEDVPTKMRKCEMCARVVPNTKGRMALGMKHLVSIPEIIALPHSGNVSKVVHEFVTRHNKSHTIFQIAEERCGSYPIHVDFSLSRSWFYGKYWKRHTIGPRNIMAQKLALFGDFGPSAVDRRNKSYEPKTASLAENPLGFKDKELTIAVHVRRGDFFRDSKRKLMRDTTYMKIIRTVQDIVEEAGGTFAKMPVAVYIYSEGKPKEGHGFATHVRKRLTREYLDFSGNVRDARWWESLLNRQKPQERGRPASRRGATPKKPRVELRISRPTVESLHQMVRADIFIGSASGLSTYLVRSLARGVQLYPGMPDSAVDAFCCSTSTDWDTGEFDRARLMHQWLAYKKANIKYVDHSVNPTILKQLRGSVKIGIDDSKGYGKMPPSRSRYGRRVLNRMAIPSDKKLRKRWKATSGNRRARRS